MSKYVTARELASILNVCTETIRRNTRSGKIPAIVINSRHKKYDVEAVERAIKKQNNNI